MPDARVRVDGAAEPMVIRINGSDPTFRLRSDVIRATALKDLDAFSADLLEISAAVFAADGAVPRGGSTRPEMGAGWRRHFEFTIPVRNPDHWSTPRITNALVDAVEFLTEDFVTFTFEQAETSLEPQPYLELHPQDAAFEAEEVVMFSGGLDSFAGALEVLSSPSSKIILVSHRSAQKVIPRQVELGEYLTEKFPGRVLHVQVMARRVGKEARDTTQRSRSLFFAALGQAVARAFGARRVSFFENGIISHNLPISPQVVGSMASRTTHPLALRKLGEFMMAAIPEAVPIENRFQWMTKSEVVGRIYQHGAVDQIPRAVSCTSVREQDALRTHCGACSQCLDRRFAILAAGLEEYDPPEIYLTDVLLGDRDKTLSATMALEWTRHYLKMRRYDQATFISKFGVELSRVIKGYPAENAENCLRQAIDLHKRQSEIVTRVLEEAVKTHVAGLVAGSISQRSLLRRLLGDQDADGDALSIGPQTRPHREQQPEVEEVDLGQDADGALRVAIWVEDDTHIVAVEGLGRVTGRPAQVPHGLKPQFSDDRAEGLELSDYAYLAPAEIPGFETATKEVVRSAVSRCRKTLEENYRLLHGHGPPAHLLIQTRSPKGYRLDPTIELIPPDALR